MTIGFLVDTRTLGLSHGFLAHWPPVHFSETPLIKVLRYTVHVIIIVLVISFHIQCVDGQTKCTKFMEFETKIVSSAKKRLKYVL